MRPITDDIIIDATYDFMLSNNMNYLPQLKQMRKFGDFRIGKIEKQANGNWLANAITRRGGITSWRRQLKLLTEEEYQAAVKKWRERYGSNPYAEGDEPSGEHLRINGTA